VAVMRKMITMLNAMVRHWQQYLQCQLGASTGWIRP